MSIFLKRTKTFVYRDYEGWIEAGGGFVYCSDCYNTYRNQ